MGTLGVLVIVVIGAAAGVTLAWIWQVLDSRRTKTAKS
jgi:hypothetical protein